MTIVWGELNIVGLLTVLSQFVILIIFIVRASDRSIRAETAANAATKAANEAHEKIAQLENLSRRVEDAQKCANQCKDQITIMNGAFAAYRESVAMNYVSRDVLRQEADDIEKSIEKLGKHIKDLIDARGPVGSRPHG